jgi:hypothetical protein
VLITVYNGSCQICHDFKTDSKVVENLSIRRRKGLFQGSYRNSVLKFKTFLRPFQVKCNFFKSNKIH